MNLGELDKVVASFYNRFVLRDVLGKAVPGSILLLLMFSIFGFFNHISLIDVIRKVSSSSVLRMVAILPFAWLAGFAMQSLGEWVYILYRPKREKQEKMYNIMLNNDIKDKMYDRLERHQVILEATGNTSISIFLWGVYCFIMKNYLNSFCLVGVGLVLLRWHWIQAERLWDWYSRLLKEEIQPLRCWVLRNIFRGWQNK